MQQQQKDIVCLIQDFYCIKLANEYRFDVNKKTFAISLDDNQLLLPHKGEVDVIRLQMYRKIVESICYSAIIIKLDVTKVTLCHDLVWFGSIPKPNQMTLFEKCQETKSIKLIRFDSKH